MKKQNINFKKGFTIIEVVLVLAIAGLIFLMVFVAWPALQRSQKDTQRRDDYAMLSTAVSDYITNNNGKLANIINATLEPKTYINKTGEDPDGITYTLKAIECDQKNAGTACTNSDITSKPKAGYVYIVTKADCESAPSGYAVPTANPSSRSFAIYGYLEGGSQTFCSASQ